MGRRAEGGERRAERWEAGGGGGGEMGDGSGDGRRETGMETG